MTYDLWDIRPQIHILTNYITVNDVVNACLSVGATAIGGDALCECAQITENCDGLVINTGTPSPERLKVFLSSGKRANELGIPIVLDPVGAGATDFRREMLKELLKEVHFTCIRGNASEILSLVAFDKSTKGVDSVISSDSAIDAAMELAGINDCVVVISGEVDYIIDKSRVARVFNGNPMMAKVTGLGCTASAMVGAFCAVDSDYFRASANAMAIMGIAGDMAVKKSAGPGSLQMNFIDQLYNLTAEDVKANLIKRL